MASSPLVDGFLIALLSILAFIHLWDRRFKPPSRVVLADCATQTNEQELPATADRATQTDGHEPLAAVHQETPPPAKVLGSKCFRINNIPSAWSRDELLGWLNSLDDAWQVGDGDRVSMYPACNSDKWQTALVNLMSFPLCFRAIEQSKEKTFAAGKLALRLSVDLHFWDLTPLNNPLPDENIIADVVAVTGLAGHAFGSWRNRDSQCMWLQDFLAHDVSSVRIMTYGYDTDLTESTDTSSLMDLRRNLIHQLENARNTEQAKRRPIIFVGHSLGGILVLQALVQAKRTKSHKHLFDSTRALFLFGTPHHGLHTAELEAMVADLSKEAETPRSKLLIQLRENSEFLEEQKESLIEIWNQLSAVISFYETKPTPTVQKSAGGNYRRTGELKDMVQKLSGQLYLAKEVRVPVHEDHTELVKFRLQNNSTYQTFLRYLRDTIAEIQGRNDRGLRLGNIQANPRVISASIEISGARKQFLDALNAPDYSAFRRNEKQPAKGTLGWFLEEADFKRWHNGPASDLLSISGSPGQGKTVIAKFILNNLERNFGGQRDTHIVYFFSYDQDENLCTVNSLLRSLIDQLLKLPGSSMLGDILPKPDKFAAAINSNDELFNIFSGLVQKLRGKVKRVFIILDGLDECEKRSFKSARADMLQKMTEIVNSYRDPVVKILMTTRPEAEILDEIERFPRFDLVAHQEDLHVFIQERVGSLPKRFNSHFRTTAAEMLLKQSGNTFLWVSIVVKKLKLLKFTSAEGLEKVVRDSSTDLDVLYKEIFDEIRNEGAEVQKLMLWVAYGRRPLSLKELEVAIAICLDLRNGEFPAENKSMLDVTKESLITVLGIILDVTDDGIVQLIHQSAKEYIEASAVFVDLPFSPGLPPDIFIAKSCMFYLNYHNFGPASTSSTFNVREMKTNYPLLDYAAENWHAHIRNQSNIFHVSKVLAKLIQPPKLYFWARAAGISGAAEEHPLIIAMKKNIEWLVFYLLRKDRPIQITPEAHKYALSSGSPIIATAALEVALDTSEIWALQSVMSNKNASKEVIQGGWSGKQTITADIVKEAASNWVKGNELMEELVRREDSEFTEDAVEAIAQFFDEGKLLCVLGGTSGSEIIQRAIWAGAKNRRSGKTIVKKLLEYSVIDVVVDEAIIQEAYKNDVYGREIIDILAESTNTRFLESTFIAAMKFFDYEQVCRLFSLRLLNKEPIIITENFVRAAAKNKYSCDRIMELLLNQVSTADITENFIAVVARLHSEKIMELLLNKVSGIEITENVIRAAAKNKDSRDSIMELLLNKVSNIETIEDFIVYVAESYPEKIIELLLKKASGIEITEDVIVHVAQSYPEKIMTLLLEKHPGIEITERVIAAVARNSHPNNIIDVLLNKESGIEIMWTEDAVIHVAQSCPEKIMKSLLEKYPGIEITERVIIAAARQKQGTMKLLLDRDPSIDITENVVIAAAGNGRSGMEVMEMLLKRKPNIEITENVVIAAAGNWGPGMEVLELLLERKPNIEITENVVIAAAGKLGPDMKFLKLLLERKPNIGISENVVIAVARKLEPGMEVLELLLERKPNIEITENITVAAAGNVQSGIQIMELLLERKPNIEITENVVIAAAGNWGPGMEVLELLLERKPNIEITENVTIAAAGNWRSGMEVMKILLEWKSNIDITENVTIAAAGNWRSGMEVLELLLERKPNIEITENVTIAAAGNWRSGMKVMNILLEWKPNIEITENVVIAAAGNGGQGIMKILLERIPSIDITESVAIAAAGNERYGMKVLKLLVERKPSIDITENVTIAAAGNWQSGMEVMKILLIMRPSIEITEKVSIAAARNRRSGIGIIELLLKKNSRMEITKACSHYRCSRKFR